MLKANLLYLLWGMALAVLSGEGALLYLEQSLQTKNILKFLLLNVSPFGGHLWYLGAILYTLFIVCLVDKLHLRKLLYALVPFLLAGDLLLGKYALLLWGREFPYILVRNFLFVGIPYFLIGTFLRKQKIRWSTGKLFAAVLLFSLTTLLERYCLVQAQANATRDHYISTTFLACAVFLLFLRIYKTRAPGTMEKWMAHVGKDASTWIYIIHPIFVSIVGVLIGRLGWNSPYGYIAPFVIYAVSILVTVCLTSLLRAVPRTQYPTHMWH